MPLGIQMVGFLILRQTKDSSCTSPLSARQGGASKSRGPADLVVVCFYEPRLQVLCRSAARVHRTASRRQELLVGGSPTFEQPEQPADAPRPVNWQPSVLWGFCAECFASFERSTSATWVRPVLKPLNMGSPCWALFGAFDLVNQGTSAVEFQKATADRFHRMSLTISGRHILVCDRSP